MVYIPKGQFVMGSPDTEKDRYKDEGPQHVVNIKPFYMSKYPITQQQWQAVMGNNPSRVQRNQHPVDRISWNEAIKFCKKLSKITGKAYRLPSESEWEYACRAGTTTPFYFGETITSDLAHYRGRKVYASEPKGVNAKGTIEVGQFPPNAFGLYDMHGNVREWCADPWYELRVLRGGSWFVQPAHCRSAARSKFVFHRGSNNIGFRPVISIGLKGVWLNMLYKIF